MQFKHVACNCTKCRVTELELIISLFTGGSNPLKPKFTGAVDNCLLPEKLIIGPY